MRLAEIECSEHINLFVFFQTVTLRLVVLECFPHRQPHSMTEIHSCSGHMAAPAFVVGVPASCSFRTEAAPTLFLLPASDRSGELVNIRLGHDFSNSNLERAPHCYGLSRKAVRTNRMYLKMMWRCHSADCVCNFSYLCQF